MAYTITLRGYGSFGEWQEIYLKAPTMYFAREREAEEMAREMDDLAWDLWDRSHADASEDEKLQAADHAPAFEAEKAPIGMLSGTPSIQYEEDAYKEIAVEIDQITQLKLWAAFELVDGEWKIANEGVRCENSLEFSRFSSADRKEIESAVVRVARSIL